MIKKLLLMSVFMIASLSTLNTSAQIVINEVQYEGTDMVELKNLGDSSVDVSNYWLCDFPAYSLISSLTVESGSTTIPAGGFLVLSGFSIDNDSELGLYSSAAFASSAAIVDYVEWGSSGHTRSPVGVSAGTWTTSNFIPAVSSGQSIQFDGSGDTSSDYAGGTPTFGAENFNDTLSSEIISGDISLGVYPNPTSDILNIKTNKENYSITVFNIVGTAVLQTKAFESNTSIDISALSSGIYILEIATNDNTFVKTKLIKK